MEKDKKLIMPQKIQKLETTMNERDSIIMLLTETFGVECKDNIIDFSENKEFVELLNTMHKRV